MQRLHRLLFDSCRSTNDTIIPHRFPSSDLAADDLPTPRETPSYLWRKDTKWHIISSSTAPSHRTKIDSHSPSPSSDILFPSKTTSEDEYKTKRKEFAVKAVKESMAVVKKSEDPRRDFRRSMVEMVVEKEMYDAVELEELLRCFLSLNSRQHHADIVAAFADVWEAMFSEDSGG